MPLIQLGEKIPTKKSWCWSQRGGSAMCWFNWGSLSHRVMALFLAGPRPASREESNAWRQTRQWQQGIALDLICLLHSLPELWIKQRLSVPWQLLLFPCACAYPEHSQHSTTSVRAVRMGRCTKDQTFLLDDEIQDLSQQLLYWGSFKVAKNLTHQEHFWGSFSDRSVRWSDSPHSNTSLCKVQGQTLLPTTLRITQGQIGKGMTATKSTQERTGQREYMQR